MSIHARRIAYKRGKLPPGLAFPSTLGDYTLWHGDFHMNYNFQQPFYGDYAANQIEVGDSYFDAMKPILQLGKLIAKRYYDNTETFVQLSGYPIEAQDDIIGCAPMGRMVYITGWAGHQYFWRYLYSLRAKTLKDAKLIFEWISRCFLQGDASIVRKKRWERRQKATSRFKVFNRNEYIYRGSGFLTHRRLSGIKGTGTILY